ncbi:uncharacterized protein FAM241A isoform X1 [Brachyhypopomus gauderio]|uniref:uncharacterized protein FAM241A isoform X1 n=1 Tax=Brachyhypopomus gauderio TaxID=698409 RepID=UPI0040436402
MELLDTISSTQHKWRAQETRLHKEVTSLTSLLSELRYMTDHLIEKVRTEQLRTSKCEQTPPSARQEVHGTANHDAELCAKMTSKQAGEDAEVSYFRCQSERGETEGHILKQQKNYEVELGYKSTQEIVSGQHTVSIKESLRLRIQKVCNTLRNKANGEKAQKVSVYKHRPHRSGQQLQAKIEGEANGMQQLSNGTPRWQNLEQGLLQALEEHLEICRWRQRERDEEGDIL